MLYSAFLRHLKSIFGSQTSAQDKGHGDKVTIRSKIRELPTHWEGKACVLEMKEADYNWKQMEWWTFYFKLKFMNLFGNDFKFPEENANSKSFDFQGEINWGLNVKSLKSDEFWIELGDKRAMDKSIKENGFHGEIIALCNVEYNDRDRTFQKWRADLEGTSSESGKKKPVSLSWYRKTQVTVTGVLIMILSAKDVQKLGIIKKGKKPNAKPLPERYFLDIDEIDNFEHTIVAI